MKDLLSQFTKIFSDFAELNGILVDSPLDFYDLMALAWIHFNRGCSASEVADALYVSRSTVTRIRDTLVDAGLVREYLDAKDQRKCNFRSTNRGKNVLYEVDKRMNAPRAREQIETMIALRRSLLQACAEAGISKISDTNQRLLLILYAAQEPLSGRQLRDYCCLAQSKVSMALKTLRTSGLIEEAENSGDARVRAVRLTESGIELSRRMVDYFSCVE